MERALPHSRSEQLKAKPGERVAKCITLMMDVDPRLFSRMNIEEKETLMASLEELETICPFAQCTAPTRTPYDWANDGAD